MALGVTGKKSGVYIREDGGATWTQLIGAKSFDMPDGDTPEIITTWLGSETEEYISGTPDLGTITIPMVWEMESATDVLLTSLSHDADADGVRPEFDVAFRVRKKDGTFGVKGARAFIKNYKQSVTGNKDANAAELTLRLVGRLTVAPVIP